MKKSRISESKIVTMLKGQNPGGSLHFTIGPKSGSVGTSASQCAQRSQQYGEVEPE
jgi:hypothetical protein